jgi:hypothetical protein
MTRPHQIEYCMPYVSFHILLILLLRFACALTERQGQALFYDINIQFMEAHRTRANFILHAPINTQLQLGVGEPGALPATKHLTEVRCLEFGHFKYVSHLFY